MAVQSALRDAGTLGTGPCICRSGRISVLTATNVQLPEAVLHRQFQGYLLIFNIFRKTKNLINAKHGTRNTEH